MIHYVRSSRPVCGPGSPTDLPIDQFPKPSSARGRAGTTPRRRRRVPRASALARQRVGIGASDRSAGRVRPRKPSVPWTRVARPLARGRHGVVPGTSPRKPSAALPNVGTNSSARKKTASPRPGTCRARPPAFRSERLPPARGRGWTCRRQRPATIRWGSAIRRSAGR